MHSAARNQKNSRAHGPAEQQGGRHETAGGRRERRVRGEGRGARGEGRERQRQRRGRVEAEVEGDRARATANRGTQEEKSERRQYREYNDSETE